MSVTTSAVTTLAVTTLHQRPAGDPMAVRVVSDGLRLWKVLFVPLTLLVARLWLAFVVWLFLVALALALVAAGWLSPGAALLATALLHLGLALDAPDLERRRLQRRGWAIVALAGAFGLREIEGPPETASPVSAPVSRTGPEVLGLFPDEG